MNRIIVFSFIFYAISTCACAGIPTKKYEQLTNYAQQKKNEYILSAKNNYKAIELERVNLDAEIAIVDGNIKTLDERGTIIDSEIQNKYSEVEFQYKQFKSSEEYQNAVKNKANYEMLLEQQDLLEQALEEISEEIENLKNEVKEALELEKSIKAKARGEGKRLINSVVEDRIVAEVAYEQAKKYKVEIQIAYKKLVGEIQRIERSGIINDYNLIFEKEESFKRELSNLTYELKNIETRNEKNKLELDSLIGEKNKLVRRQNDIDYKIKLSKNYLNQLETSDIQISEMPKPRLSPWAGVTLATGISLLATGATLHILSAEEWGKISEEEYPGLEFRHRGQDYFTNELAVGSLTTYIIGSVFSFAGLIWSCIAYSEDNIKEYNNNIKNWEENRYQISFGGNSITISGTF